RAGLEGRIRDLERDAAHPTLHVAPDRPLAQQVPLVMHELHLRGAGVARAGEGADHALPEQGLLERLVPDVAVEDARDRVLERDRDQLLVADRRLELLAARRATLPRIPERARAQQPPEALEGVLVGGVALDVGAAEALLAKRGQGALALDVERHRAAV